MLAVSLIVTIASIITTIIIAIVGSIMAIHWGSHKALHLHKRMLSALSFLFLF